MEGKSPARKFEVLMLFIAKADNKHYEIEVRESATEWEVGLKEVKTGKKEVYRLSKKDYQQFGEVISFIFNHRSYLIDTVNNGDEYTVFTKGSHKTIELLTEEKMLYKKLAGADNGEGEIQIKAGMPGKVVEIHTKAGDNVKEGALLLVIEAMKMENEIRAGNDGEVKKICVKEGQNVETGTPLLLLKTK